MPFSRRTSLNFGGDYSGGISPRIRRSALEGLFQPDNVEDVAADMQEEDPMSSLLSRMRGIYGAESPALEKYRTFSKNIPSRDEFSPGIMGRIGAALEGFATGMQSPAAGFEAVRNRLDLPYRHALEDYGIQRELLGEEAEIERYDRQNQLKALEAEMESLFKQDESSRDWADTLSQIGRRNSQNRTDQGNLDLRGREFDFEQNVKFPHTKAMGEGNLRVQQRFAGTGEANARTSARNADTNAARLAETRRSNRAGERNDMFRIGAGMINNMQPDSSDFIQPSQQRTARELAMEELMMDPEWSEIAADYIDFTGNFPKIKMDGAMDRDFYTELLEREQKYHSRRRR